MLTAVAAPPAHAASVPSLIAFESTGGVWAVHPGNVNSERLFLGQQAGWFPPSDAVWSPNGLELAFFSTIQGGGADKIQLADRTGRVIATPLRNQPASGPLTWSPDGKRIAYWCPHQTGTDPNGNPTVQIDVCVLDVATGAHRLLAALSRSDLFIYHAGGCQCRMSWSPKGNVIALDVVHSTPIQCPPGVPPGLGGCTETEPKIGLIDVANGTLTQLTTHGAFQPQFSPDGSEIVYQGRSGVDIMSASGGDIRQVVPNSRLGNHLGGQGDNPMPAWSPDGKQIVFGSFKAPANIHLFTVSVHGGHMTQVTNTGMDSTGASWAPAVTLCTVPKLKGQTLNGAKKLLKRAGCVLGSVGGPKANRSRLHVIKQSPGANRNVAAGTKVNVRLG